MRWTSGRKQTVNVCKLWHEAGSEDSLSVCLDFFLEVSNIRYLVSSLLNREISFSPELFLALVVLRLLRSPASVFRRDVRRSAAMHIWRKTSGSLTHTETWRCFTPPQPIVGQTSRLPHFLLRQAADRTPSVPRSASSLHRITFTAHLCLCRHLNPPHCPHNSWHQGLRSR